jgi:anion-transporting  ArsA/GET3 family ATPase
VSPQAFAAAGLRPRGELYAMMLDVRQTWDGLVTRYAPTPERRQRILQNKLYRQMSAALAGSQEYMATEKLYELATDRDYDLVVLDTPPTSHALDFLDAPGRILDFLGDEDASLLIGPARGAGRLTLRLAQLGGSYAVKTLARFTGGELLHDLGQFLGSFQGMYDGFKARAAAVRQLLSEPSSGFVLVASPTPLAVGEALALHARLAAERMPVAGVVVNRVTPDLWTEPGPLPDGAELARPLAALVPPGPACDALALRLAVTLADHQRLAAADAATVARVFAAVGGSQVAVPRLSQELHDLAGLAALAGRLRGGPLLAGSPPAV